MIQVIGYRLHEYANGKVDIAQYFLDRNWGTTDIPTLFNSLPTILAKIPEEERWNLHYTIADCLDGKGRQFHSQEVIPFDLDKIDCSRLEEYIDIFVDTVQVPREKIGIVCSGNGLHFLVKLSKPFTERKFFGENKPAYNHLCKTLESAIKKVGLPIKEVDTNVFRPTATLRLPGTINRKQGIEDKECYAIQTNIQETNFSFSSWFSTQAIAVDSGQVDSLKAYPPPDSEGVKLCPFLIYCHDNQPDVTEPQWYASLTILGRLENPLPTAIEYSRHHPKFTEEETEKKLAQAISAGGPRTCSNIATLWDGCVGCEFRVKEKIASPIQICGPNFIKTKNQGFHDIVMNKNGGVKYLPNYEDLRKHFHNQHPYITMADSGIVYIYKNKKWEMVNSIIIDAFAQSNFIPAPKTNVCSEFRGLIMRTNLRNPEWLNPVGLVNFKNGVFNMDTMEFTEHSMDYGFTYILEHSYDKDAGCPEFDTFMKTITLNRQELEDTLLEYIGYCISNMPCDFDKAMILSGTGSNGKSTLMNVIKELVGKESYSSLMLNDLDKDTNRFLLCNKLFNLAEETPRKSLLDSSVFKNMVSGGDMMVKMLYQQPFSIRNRCKLLIAANTLPKSLDMTYGLTRRLIIAPFDKVFDNNTKDPFIEKKLMKELPGIFNRVVIAYHTLIKRGGFATSDILEEQIEIYKQENNSILYWINECCQVTKQEMNLKSIAGEMYEHYKNFCVARSLYTYDYVEFRKYITINYEKDAVIFSRNTVNGNKLTAIANLSLASSNY